MDTLNFLKISSITSEVEPSIQLHKMLNLAMVLIFERSRRQDWTFGHFQWSKNTSYQRLIKEHSTQRGSLLLGIMQQPTPLNLEYLHTKTFS